MKTVMNYLLPYRFRIILSVIGSLLYMNSALTLGNLSIHRYISALPKGCDTILTDNGSNISRGQKQMITIARAMLLDSKILVLDEAASNVDTTTERRIQQAMLRLMENRTCFVIAHRLSTIEHADLILVLKNGAIVEQGTHVELIKKKGVYRQLYDAQFVVQ